MRRCRTWPFAALGVVALFTLAATAASQPIPQPDLRTTRISEPPVIDGVVNDTALSGPPIALFRILSPLHQAHRQASLRIDGLLADLGGSGQEGLVLAFVAARDGAPVISVVRLPGVPKATITSILRRLGLSRRLLGKPGALLAPGETPHNETPV